MAKSKHGPALFDLLVEDEQETAEALKVPRWWGHEGHPKTPGADAGESVNDSVAGASQGSDAAEGRRHAVPASVNGPVFEVDGDRIRFSLGNFALAVVLMATVIALAGVFVLGRGAGDGNGYARGFDEGRASYAADAMSEIEAARQQPPATELIGSLLTEAATVSTEPVTPAVADESQSVTPLIAKPATPAPWIAGHTYVVAQEFSSGRRDDAVRTKAFLAAGGIDTALIELSAGSMQLITTQGFDRDDPAQRSLADNLLGRVRAIGVEFFAQRGGYRLEGYFKKLKGNTW